MYQFDITSESKAELWRDLLAAADALTAGEPDAVANMANAVKKISVARGYDVTQYTLQCFGGAGGQHACAVADALGMTRVFVHPLAGVLKQNLRRTEHVAGGDVGRLDPAGQAQALAVLDRGGPTVGVVAQVHDRQRRRSGDRMPMAAPGMVGMTVGDQCSVDRAGGIDPGVGGDDVDAPRLGPDPGEVRGH